MTKIIFAFLLLAIMLGFAGCSSNGSGDASSTPIPGPPAGAQSAAGGATTRK